MQEAPMPTAKGRLTIFLGYSAGIGKTAAMLAAARQNEMNGQDVVLASNDPDILRLNSGGLEVVSSLSGGPGINLDALLERRPKLALIGRLAHSNPPGARHPQRWQDVEEILQNGIHVSATLNVVEIASLSDSAQRFSALPSTDSVPDHLVDEAELVLVDLPPTDLVRRNPIDLSDREITALSALRELCLDFVARHVDRQLHEIARGATTSTPLPTRPRLMVCVSAHPISERLVRTGRRLARELNADWVVVYVETPERLSYSRPHNERLARILRLAEELGARVVGITGRTVPQAVTDYARANHITQIIVGKPLRPRWLEVINGSLVDEIIRLSGAADVYVISDDSGPLNPSLPQTLRPHAPAGRYLLAALMVGLVSILCIPIHFYIQSTNLVMLYLLAVIISALYLGRGPSILASMLSVLAFDFFFTDPKLSFSVYDTQYLLTFLGLFGTGLAISNLAGLVRSQVETSQNRELRTATLYNLSRELTRSSDLNAVLQTVLLHLSQTFERKAVIMLPEKVGLEIRAASPGLSLSSAETEAAEWAYQHAQPAGLGTNTLPETPLRWQPLQTVQGVVGVLGVQPNPLHPLVSMEQRQLLEAYSSLAALAIERASLADQASRARLLQEAEKLQSALLNSISHDLRTPLASVTGALSSLHEAEAEDSEIVMDHATRLELIDTGWEEAERLNRLVGNLLDMSRLEAGAVRLNREDGDIEDIIGAALSRLRNRLRGYHIHTQIPASRPLVWMDSVLIEQVLVNLIDNAAKYSPLDSHIEVGVDQTADQLNVWVADQGRGIPEGDLEHIFEKFFRVQRPDGVSGSGLGLSICKGIVEIHGGTIRAQNRPTGGTQITFSLPSAETAEVTNGVD
jgi:two-component system, OmpR family, sensor histidine kinase KdpD